MVCLKNSKLNGGLFIAGTFIYQWGIFQHTMFDCRRKKHKQGARLNRQQGAGVNLPKKPNSSSPASLTMVQWSSTSRLWTQSQVLNSYVNLPECNPQKKHHQHWAFIMLTLCTISISVPTALHGPNVTPHTSPRPQRRSRKPPSGADRSKSSQAFMQWVCLMGQTCWTYVIIVTSLLPLVIIHQ